jgi:thymidylate synthase
VEALVEHFRLYPDSRRQVATIWSPKYLDPKVVGVCITQLYCRLRNNALDLHSHARANDAYRLLLLDMQLAIGVQREIARQLGVSAGRYAHYVDSLHFYKRYKIEIEKQRKYMQNSPVWKEL